MDAKRPLPTTTQYMKTRFNTAARDLLVDIIRNPYAWPGGYERLLILADGALLCSACARKEASRIMGDIRDGYNTGWLPVSQCYEAVSPEYTKKVSEDLLSYCGHCNKEIGEC